MRVSGQDSAGRDHNNARRIATDLVEVVPETHLPGRIAVFDYYVGHRCTLAVPHPVAPVLSAAIEPLEVPSKVLADALAWAMDGLQAPEAMSQTWPGWFWPLVLMKLEVRAAPIEVPKACAWAGDTWL